MAGKRKKQGMGNIEYSTPINSDKSRVDREQAFNIELRIEGWWPGCR
jgi:hypothetical protein